MNEKMKELIRGIYERLNDEQKERAKTCQTVDDFIEFVEEEGLELPDELLEAVSGGIQAGFFTTGGPGEFGTSNPDPEEQKPQYPTWF